MSPLFAKEICCSYRLTCLQGYLLDVTSDSLGPSVILNVEYTFYVPHVDVVFINTPLANGIYESSCLIFYIMTDVLILVCPNKQLQSFIITVIFGAKINNITLN